MATVTNPYYGCHSTAVLKIPKNSKLGQKSNMNRCYGFSHGLDLLESHVGFSKRGFRSGRRFSTSKLPFYF